jgi:tripartite-type tricarboxylate transporter receptor subunit TctC
MMKGYFHGKLHLTGWSGLVRGTLGKSGLLIAIVTIAILILVTVTPMVRAADADFPKKPINLYVPFPPGGFFDIVHRPLAEEIGKILGQTVVVVNKPGASGTLSASMLKSVKPDGYNISVVSTSIFYLPAQEDVTFDPLKDFTYVCRTIDSLMGVVVRADSPWKTLKEFLAYAKANPGKIKYATASPRGGMRFAMSEIALKEGITWDVVPFSGGQEVVTALLGKHVDAIVQGMEWVPHVDSGELRVLAVLGSQRSKRYPAVSTLKELGYGAHESPLGIVGPAGMPKDVTDKLANAFKKALDDAKMQKVLGEVNAPLIYMNSTDYSAWAKSAVTDYADRVKKAGLGKK